jgi:uracil-DNA glycosylase family protein
MPRQKSTFDANTEGAAPFVPAHPTLKNMRAAVQDCKGCDLYAHATQAVFGEGPASSRIVLVGEQPGNSEDLAGRPFVGPAGEILDRALQEVGLDRSQVYVTNAVKHFAFEERGKRRIHRTPRQSEINACRPWIEAELDVIKPDIVVCLGATAAKALMGSHFASPRSMESFAAPTSPRKLSRLTTPPRSSAPTPKNPSRPSINYW